MALLFADGFDHYATADILKKWSTLSSSGGGLIIAPTSGRRGGGAMSFGNVCYALKYFADSQTVIIGFSIKPTSIPTVSTGYRILQGQDSTYAHFGLQVNPGGVLSLHKYANTTASLLGTSATTLSVGTTYYLEVKYKIDATSAGTYEVKLNGASVISGTGITKNTSSSVSTVKSFYIGCLDNSGTQWLCDDLYVCDGTGTTNNDFLGDVRIDCLHPNADGTYSQFSNSLTAGVAHRYWRVYIDSDIGGTSSYPPTCRELEFRTTAGGADVTSGGTAIASTADATNSAANAFDNTSAYWSAVAGTGPSGWIGYDFGVGNEKDIREFAWTALNSSQNLQWQNTAPTSMRLQWSDNNTDWFDLVQSGAIATWASQETKVFTYAAPAGHYVAVDDPTLNASDSVYSKTVGQKETFAFDNLSVATGTIFGVQLVNTMAKDDSGNRSASNLLKSSATEVTVSQAYLGYGSPLMNISVHETDPATSAAWLVSGINALEAGATVSS